MVYERHFEGERALIAVNMSDEEAKLSRSIDFGGLAPALDNVSDEKNDPYVLKPWQAVIYK